jgi:hypothetical protein
MADNTDQVFNKFFQHRTRPLTGRFPNFLRAIIIETNDPLSMGRVRFKCPELHDFDLPPGDCPWAVPSFDLGGEKAARFVAPTIGDWVFISFEKGHPYAPIWTGFCNPTRRRLYAYPQVFNITPVSLNENGRPQDPVVDYNRDYLPKDGRPMGHGWVDRYGNMDLHSSIGYFPSAHKELSPPSDVDAITGNRFRQFSRAPEVNNPDSKYMARVTKYGHVFIMGDQGYWWQSENDFDSEDLSQEEKLAAATLGEFTGDFSKDERFEFQRWKYVQKLLNNGHSLSRHNEFGRPSTLSIEQERDHRWIKFRTKAGMLFQMYDKGAHPWFDKFVRRTNLEDDTSEREDVYWGRRLSEEGEEESKDARFIRMVTRYGIKLVLDDRGSDAYRADRRELPRGNGFLVKGRRTPAAKARDARGNARGFVMEFNENDEANHMTFSSPLGQTIEINDRYQYMIMSASLGKGWVRKHQGIKENEFSRKPAMIRNPELTSHHLKIDHDNEYIRLKTRGGKGVKPETPANPSGVAPGQLQQGIEMHDGTRGLGPWVEIVDSDRRGMWFSKREKLGIWRARSGRRMYMWMDERPSQEKIVIYNNQAQGVIEIFANRSVNVISNRDVSIRADRHIFMKAGRNIFMQAGGLKWTMLRNGVIQSNSRIFTGGSKYQKRPSFGNQGEIVVKPTMDPLRNVLEKKLNTSWKIK